MRAVGARIMAQAGLADRHNIDAVFPDMPGSMMRMKGHGAAMRTKLMIKVNLLSRGNCTIEFFGVGQHRTP